MSPDASSRANKPKSIIVSVPASAANLGPGFDSLGVALQLRNVFHFTLRSDSHVSGEAIGPEAGVLYIDEDNLAAKAFRAGWSLASGRDQSEAPGCDIAAEVNIPQARGLGSSSTALVAGAAAGWKLGGGGDTGEEFLNLVSWLEGHPDNVLPAAVGGLVCGAWNPEAKWLDGWRRFPVHDSLSAALLIPDEPLPTEEARSVLPVSVDYASAVHNIARAPLVVEGLRTGDLELLARAVEDRVHEPFRRRLLPLYDRAKALAKERGLPCSLSGAGPTMIAWAAAGEQVRELAEAFGDLAAEGGGGRSLALRPSAEGWREEPEE